MGDGKSEGWRGDALPVGVCRSASVTDEGAGQVRVPPRSLTPTGRRRSREKQRCRCLATGLASEAGLAPVVVLVKEELLLIKTHV